MKTKCEHTKSNDASRAHPIVAINANLIAHNAPKDIDMAKCVDLIAYAFSVHGIGDIVMINDTVRQHDSKRESVRRTCEKEEFKISLLEKRAELSSIMRKLLKPKLNQSL